MLAGKRPFPRVVGGCCEPRGRQGTIANRWSLDAFLRGKARGDAQRRKRNATAGADWRCESNLPHNSCPGTAVSAARSSAVPRFPLNSSFRPPSGGVPKDDADDGVVAATWPGSQDTAAGSRRAQVSLPQDRQPRDFTIGNLQAGASPQRLQPLKSPVPNLRAPPADWRRARHRPLNSAPREENRPRVDGDPG
jgi:hypothetical protein